MKRIMYLRPINRKVSFSVVSDRYSKALKEAGYHVVDNDVTKPVVPDERFDICIMHPILYPMTKYPRTYRRILQKCEEWIGFDVSDSDHLSPLAAYVISLFDRVAVPSKFCAAVFDKSAVTSKIYVVPHHLSDEFMRDDIETDNAIIKALKSMKVTKILFFLWHSGYRKGADIVAEAWARIAKKVDAILIVKRTSHYDPMLEFFYNLPNVIVINEWLSTKDLVALYDAVDIVVVPSRGGGFELNALEALARGRIVITSEWYPIQEYCEPCIKCKSRGRVKIFPSNTAEGLLHDGYGIDPDPNDFTEKLLYAIEHKDDLLPRFEEYKHVIREKYSFDSIKSSLIDFVEGV